jgi:hypothetical protein
LLQTDSRYDGQFVLICWHHGKLPELAQALGATPPVAKWPGAVFDRYWVIHESSKGKRTLDDRPQSLLFGDSKH